MNFRFSGSELTGKERKLQRVFEIAPGATSWTILIGMIVCAFKAPLIAAAIIIAFDFYWLLRLLYMTLFLILSYLRLSVENQTDWMKRVRGMDDLDQYAQELRTLPPPADTKKRLSLFFHR
ncbi:hypothetical protein ACFL5C_03575, partial [Candidatus Omnitrophota bacterium]